MTDPAAPQATNRALAARVWRDYLRPRWKGLAVSIVSAAVVA